MTEYIAREAALEALENADPDVYEDYGDGYVDWGFGRKNIQDMINAVPAADVAEVVRCKDCKYGDYDSKTDGAMVCLRTNDGFWRKETDFCSYGEYQTNTGGVTHE